MGVCSLCAATLPRRAHAVRSYIRFLTITLQQYLVLFDHGRGQFYDTVLDPL